MKAFYFTITLFTYVCVAALYALRFGKIHWKSSYLLTGYLFDIAPFLMLFVLWELRFIKNKTGCTYWTFRLAKSWFFVFLFMMITTFIHL